MDDRDDRQRSLLDGPDPVRARAAAEPGWPGKVAQTQRLDDSDGDSLPAPLRGDLERDLGADLSGVRLHVGPEAQAAAQSLQARAFTMGQAIYFGPGQYQPGSSTGQQLIAHEAAHTVQQQGAAGGPQLAGVAVSSPGDAHEQEAETFAAAFVAGRGATAPKPTPVSRGVISRAVIQRDLATAAPDPQKLPKDLPLPGGQGAAGQGPGGAAPGSASPLSGGAATAEAKIADATQGAPSLDGDGGSKFAAGAGPHAQGESKPASAVGASPQGETKSSDATRKDGGTQDGEAKPAAQEPGAVEASAAPGGDGPGPGVDGKPAASADAKSSPAAAGAEAGGAPAADAKAAVSADAEAPTSAEVANAAQPPALAPLSGRDEIEAELAFHEDWQKLQGDGWDRAAMLAKSLPADVLKGGAHALTETLIGSGLKFAASKVPLSHVPGIGNIVGGVFAFGRLTGKTGKDNVDAIVKMGKTIASFDGSFGAFADVVAGLLSIVDLIGTIASVVSGAAYLLAAGIGVASFFGWGLAFLPWVPMLLNIGRMASGVSNVASAITAILSPLPALLRAAHVIFSGQDPIRLVAHERAYHDEMQNAVKEWGAAAMSKPAERAVDRSLGVKPKESSGDMFGFSEGKKEFLDARDANRNLELAPTPTAEHGKAMAAEYFNPDRVTANPAELDAAQADVDGAAHRQAKAARRMEQHPGNDKKTRITNQQNLSRRNNELAEAELDLSVTRQRVQVGDVDADLAEVSDPVSEYVTDEAKGVATGSAGKTLRADAQASRDDAFVANDADRAQLAAAQRGVHGILLPKPPDGGLPAIDALEKQIAELRQLLPQQRALTAEARATQKDAKGRAAAVKSAKHQVHQAMAAKAAGHAAGQAKIQQQTGELQAKSDEASGGAGQGSGQMRAELGPLAPLVRKIDDALAGSDIGLVQSAHAKVHQFRVGIDKLTGDDGQAKSKGEMGQAIASRGAHAAEAGSVHQAAQGTGQQLTDQMGTAQATAGQVAAENAGIASDSAGAEQTIEQQLADAVARRQQRWDDLAAWAAVHRSLRLQVQAA